LAKLLQIDEQSRPDHYYLADSDDCCYILEYTPREGPLFSATNQLIFNLKKAVDRKGKPEYHHKEQAINKAGDLFREVLNEDWLSAVTLVPIPCSKVKDDPLYDDRIVRVLVRMMRGLQSDIRDMIFQSENIESFHTGCRLAPDQLKAYWSLDESLCHGRPAAIAVFDDMLTTGSHFKAAKMLIEDRWPDMLVFGVFLARVYRPAVNLDELVF
jgi:hypothetical protein